MKVPLLFLVWLWLVPLAAQEGGVLRVEPANVNKEIVVDNLDEDFQDVTSIMVTNNSGRTLQLLRDPVPIRKPASWSYLALDRQPKASPYVMSRLEQENGRPISLRPGESASFFVVLTPDGLTGTGTMELRFSDLTLPGTPLNLATITTKLSRRQTDPPPVSEQQERPFPTTVRLYPNPAPERFFVEAPRGVRVGRVEVANTLGRRIRSFDQPAGKEGYDIENLPDGLYLISVYDAAGKKIKTLRLLHRRFGA